MLDDLLHIILVKRQRSHLNAKVSNKISFFLKYKDLMLIKSPIWFFRVGIYPRAGSCNELYNLFVQVTAQYSIRLKDGKDLDVFCNWEGKKLTIYTIKPIVFWKNKKVFLYIFLQDFFF